MPNHTCDTCGSTFQRTEHLSRHKLLHLGQRPFGCPKCEREFSRRDTLQRHLTVHARNHNEHLPVTGSNRRVKHACRKCSQSKLRCDGKSPCDRCLSKNSTCWYGPPQSSKPQETRQQISELGVSTVSDDQQTVDSQPLWLRGYDDRNNSSVPFPTVSLALDESSQPESITTSSNSESIPVLANDPCNMSLSAFSTVSQLGSIEPDGSLLERTALGLQLSNCYPFCTTAQDMAFWDDPQYLAPLYQGPYADFGFVVTPQQAPSLQMERSPLEPDLDQGLSGAPVPSFLDARSSPEPNEGQGLRFDDYLRKTFANRRHFHNSAGNEQTNVASLNSRISRGRKEKAHYPPLMGAFSPLLTSEGGDTMWEPENLAHVRPLPQQTYDQMVTKFKHLNDTNGHYTQFATGNFPSHAACNAFMQLFFEEFNPLLPFLHQPTFDPAVEPWLLVLAVIATGCRFSQISAAVECVDILQEFVRRAFYAMIEEDYSSTCEPWLAQAGLLNQIGMQFSKDLRLIESSQSMRSLLASICRKINCFNESERYIDISEQQLSYTEDWKSWVRKESMRRLAYALWLVDSQFVLFFDLPPIVPTDLLRVRLPNSENLWHAPTASAWVGYSKQNSIYLPMSIRQELNELYKNRNRRHGLGDFAILLLVVGVFRNALEYRRSFQEGFGSPPGAMQGPESESMPETFPGTLKAMEYLQILCPENEEVPRLSSLKSAILHHYHTIGILLGIPLGELFCYGGYRVTSVDISRCHNRLRVWAQQRGTEARQVAFHAGRVFAHIRHSNMHGYYEGRAFLVACLSLWIYSDTAPLRPNLIGETTINETETISTSTIRFDQNVSRQIEQSWVQDDAGMRPYLAGVGCVLGVDGASRLVQEGSRVLCASHTWPFCGAMGKALRIFHKLGSDIAL